MSDRRPYQYVEIDMDYCSLTYASAPCAAVLGTTGVRKCFNTFRTCQDQENFARETKTIRIGPAVGGVPIGEMIFPCLLRVSAQSSSVNIGGADKRLSAFGKRATLDVSCKEFPYHDRFFDKYQSERVSGAAQSSGLGYDPAETGTFFARLKARWPYYAGRPIRLVDAYLDGGVITVIRTRNFILTNITKDSSDRYTIKARDPLDLANDKRAVAPAPVNGVLLEDISAVATTLTLSPDGIGDDSYPASGRALIGSEYVSFTRVGDTVTLTERGLRSTTAASHVAGDNFQTALSYDAQRVDVVAKDLLVNFAGLDSSLIPDATWAAEVTRWASNVLITTDIVKPEGVAKLMGEIAVLGFSFWWDDVAQEIGLKSIRPVDGDTLFDLSDDTAIKSLEIDDRDDDRLTEVIFSTVLRDPTQSPTDRKSYERSRYIIDVISKSDDAFGDTRIKEINCRLLDQGADDIVRQNGRRILNRQKLSPKRYKLLLDAKDRGIGLTDVLRVRSRSIQDEGGDQIPTLMQVVNIDDKRPGHDFMIEAQAYVYDGRFAFATADDVPEYDLATDAQRDPGFFAVDDITLKFSDGSGPYEAI